MKEYHKDIWMERQGDGTVTVGLTTNFIQTKLTECFHIMQADAANLKKDGPMLVIETNDGLSSLRSPVTGRIMDFNDRARNFPDKLREEDCILTILPEGVKLPSTKKAKAPPLAAEVHAIPWPDLFEPLNRDFQDLVANPEPNAPPPQQAVNLNWFQANNEQRAEEDRIRAQLNQLNQARGRVRPR